jgi:hypothetical protein
MKRIFFSFIITGLLTFVAFTGNIFAQSVGIGTTTPQPSALLELKSDDKGLLVPRITGAKRDGMMAPAKGLMVYVIDDSSFYFYDGAWRRLTPANETWNIKGNSGTNENLNFIGTTDSKPITFKVKNVLQMQLDSMGRLQLFSPHLNLIIGNGTGQRITTGTINNFIGSGAGYSNTTGSFNSFMGPAAGYNNTTGSSNTFIGALAGYNNTTGSANYFAGASAGYNDSTGSFNHFTGYLAGHNNTTGSSNYFNGYLAGLNNIAADSNHFEGFEAGLSNTTGSSNYCSGFKSGYQNISGSFNTLVGPLSDVLSGNLIKAGAIGYNAKVSQSNSFVIGGTGVDAVKVGIGTTAPQAKLDVNSNEAASNVAIFRGNGGFAQIFVTQGGTTITDLGSYPTGGYTGTNTPGDFKIRTGAIDRMFLQYTTGNVGIGTNTPSETLDVAGNIALTGIITNQAFQTPTLEVPWFNYGTGYSNAAYYKDKEGRVQLRGVVGNGGAIANSTIFILPVGYRPSTSGILVFPVLNNNNAARVDVFPDGSVKVIAGSAGWISLDGISFRAD